MRLVRWLVRWPALAAWWAMALAATAFSYVRNRGWESPR